jgi:hypothetical protein
VERGHMFSRQQSESTTLCLQHSCEPVCCRAHGATAEIVTGQGPLFEHVTVLMACEPKVSCWQHWVLLKLRKVTWQLTTVLLGQCSERLAL